MNRLSEAVAAYLPDTLKPRRPVGQLPVLAPWSPRRLNRLAAGLPNCRSYLEIGIEYGYTLRQVNVAQKVGVDPDPRLRKREIPRGTSILSVTSDQYFARLSQDARFDLIFLDGLHEWHQTYLDLINALNHSEPRTVIVIDDVVPSDRFSAIPNQMEAIDARHRSGGTNFEWHGDVYKVLLAISEFHPDLHFRVISPESGNPQAVLWQSEASAEPFVTLASPDAYEHVTFETVFENGHIPSHWRPGSEDSVIAEALSNIQSR